MKIEGYLLLIMLIASASCSQPRSKEALSDSTQMPTDTVVSKMLNSTEPARVDEPNDAPEYNTIDMQEFTKHPFPNSYPEVKSTLREEGVIFTIIANDTIHSEHRTIMFDDSQINFLDSDPSYQDELGDLICSSDIRSPKFRFNQNVAIGMAQNEFFTRASLSESSLVQGSEGNWYFENEIPFDDGHWKITIWFKGGLLTRVQSEISPCYYDYGD